MMAQVIEKVFLLSVFLVMEVVDGKSTTASLEEELLVENKLKLINKPAVKSIQSEDGDIIDCVDVYKQPAFDHPLLKNHTIQMRPSGDEHLSKRDEASTQATEGMNFQVWQRSGSCPTGTVPVLRVQKHHLLNAPSVENYGRKPWNGIAEHKLRLANRTVAAGIEGLHAYGVLIGSGYNYVGAKASINVWNPWIEKDDEFTSGQIWLRNGEFNNSDNIEVGWTVNPSVFGNRTVRFFVYWTIDSGKTTGCFNLLCPGFVQTSSEIALGGTFSGVSTYEGPQYEFSVKVWKDFNDERWWLMYGDSVVVGYWPASIFRGLSKTATLALFGGDVYSPRIKETPHPTAAMGSGTFAYEHFRHAAFFRQPRIKDYSGEFRYPFPFDFLSTQPNCYSAENFAPILWTEPLFYYGGPGRNGLYCAYLTSISMPSFLLHFSFSYSIALYCSCTCLLTLCCCCR